MRGSHPPTAQAGTSPAASVALPYSFALRSWKPKICLKIPSSLFFKYYYCIDWNLLPHSFTERLALPSGTKMRACTGQGGDGREIQNEATFPITDM